MRISDWSSDVCSSDLRGFGRLRRRSGPSLDLPLDLRLGFGLGGLLGGFLGLLLGRQLGGALGGGEGGLPLVEGGIAAGGFLNRRRGGRRGGSAGAVGSTAEGRVGKEGVRTWSSRWSPDTSIKNSVSNTPS